jgi:hypothetical protein
MPILKAYPNALYSLSEYYHFNAWGGRKEAMRARNQRKKQLLSWAGPMSLSTVAR